jgi:hypothetical protein
MYLPLCDRCFIWKKGLDILQHLLNVDIIEKLMRQSLHQVVCYDVGSEMQIYNPEEIFA